MELIPVSLLSKLSGVNSFFYLIWIASSILFLAVALLWKEKRAVQKTLFPELPEDDNRLAFLWTFIPLFILACLLFAPLRRNDLGTARPNARILSSLENP